MRRKLMKIERELVYKKFSGHCAYCGCALEFKEFTVDHVEPLSIGGADDLYNMLPACKECNRHKGDWTLEEFRRAAKYWKNKTFERDKDGKIIFYFEKMIGAKNDFSNKRCDC